MNEADRDGDAGGIPDAGGSPDADLTDDTVGEGPTDTSETADRPVWDDDYLDRVAGRLASNYDLERDYRVAGERFPLYGRMEIHSEKHFFHPALSFAHHESHEHLFARRADRVDPATVEHLVTLGHDLADEWIDADEEHYSTEFTFVLVTGRISGDVRDRVAGLDERTLLKYGFNGHYDVNVVVVAPTREEIVANEAADVTEAFAVWDEIEREEPGLLGLIARRFQL